MHIPTNFVKILKRDFNNRFRIRWSYKRNEFHLEQKLAPQQILEPPTDSHGDYDTNDDEYIRARDGFYFVMSVRTGDRMPCERCNLTVKVPICKTAEAICSRCNKHHKAAFYPLDEVLLTHLRWIDPLSGGPQRVLSEVKRDTERFEKSKNRAAFGEIEAAAGDNFNALFEIESVGYTGKEYKKC